MALHLRFRVQEAVGAIIFVCQGQSMGLMSVTRKLKYVIFLSTL